MLPRDLLVGDPGLARQFAWAAAGLFVVAVVLLVGTWSLEAADAPGPSHATLLVALEAVIGVGVVLAAVSGYLGGGVAVGAALAAAPALAVAAGMVVAPALGISNPDTTPAGGVALAVYVLALATVLGLGGFAVGRAVRWLVEQVAV